MRRRTSLHTSGRRTDLDVPAADVWRIVASGRERPQWYVDAAPFVVRGALDQALGGEGRRWRPPGTAVLSTGDTAGFWRVLEAEHEELRLVLEADVRAPGRVLLRTSVEPLGEIRCRLSQVVELEPHGWLGRTYLLADLPAREAVIELAHRRLLADVRNGVR
jgi:hypothetical protein